MLSAFAGRYVYIMTLLVNLFVSPVASHFADGVLQHGVLLIEVVDGFLALGVVVHRRLEGLHINKAFAECEGLKVLYTLTFFTSVTSLSFRRYCLWYLITLVYLNTKPVFVNTF